MIEVRPIPMRVADVVMRTRRDQQLTFMIAIVAERPIEVVTEEAEASLESPSDAGWWKRCPL
jgi:hypothetical protein